MWRKVFRKIRRSISAVGCQAKFIPNFLSDGENHSIVEYALQNSEEDIAIIGISSLECDVGAILKSVDHVDDLLTQQSQREAFVGKQWPVKKSIVNGRNIISIKNLHFIDEPHDVPSKIVRLAKPDSAKGVLISKQQFLNLIDVGSIEKVSIERTNLKSEHNEAKQLSLLKTRRKTWPTCDKPEKAHSLKTNPLNGFTPWRGESA